MIYLIAGYETLKDNNGNYYPRLALKIGYTRDNRGTKRFSMYRTRNPGVDVILTIPDLGEDIEHFLHKRFEKHKLGRNREWFTYQQEIIDYLKKIKDGEIDVTKNMRASELLDKYKVTDVSLVPLLEKWDKVGDDIFKKAEFCLKYGNFSFTPGLTAEECKFIIDFPKKDEIPKFFEEFDKLKTSTEKLKFLSNYPCDPDTKRMICYQLTKEKFIEYVNTLGWDRAKACGYNQTKLKAEFGIASFNQDPLDARIYREFHEGDCISNVDLKAKIITIYDELGYNKLAKATEILRWFEVKKIKLKDSSGKWIHGLELMKKKA